MTPAPESQESTHLGQHAFTADVSRVLDIVIHSLYSHPEIFLRELISNAADALDKRRLAALTDASLQGGAEGTIDLIPDAENHTLTIQDQGIGMGAEDLIQHLGTIAHSGSQKFLEALREKQKDGKVDAELIGQFGVGFYSAFLVADRVEVVSRPAGGGPAHRWISEAHGTYTVEPVEDAPDVGTRVILHLKEDHREFLDEYRLRMLVRQYSDFVPHPIRLEVERPEGEGEDARTTRRFERLNQGKALWKRPKDEITDEQYEEFYKHVTHDHQAPLARTHFTVEGTQLFTGLLFVPSMAPFDLNTAGKRRGVRLYVKRVFIMDDCEELLPEWLRFVRGVVDSDDLPLNVSRELLQEDRVVRTIRKVVTRKVVEMLTDLAEERPEDYAVCWSHFGAVLKEGLHYEPDHRDALAKLLRYDSSRGERTSLADYVARMPEGQKAIYYVMAPDLKTAKGSPHAESLTRKGYEILYMTDPVDEWAVHSLGTFEDQPLLSAQKADLDLDGTAEAKARSGEVDTDLEALLERTQSLLEDTVSEVRASQRLTDSPCCLVTPEGGVHAHIERMLRARQQGLPASKRIFEINPDHPVIRRLKEIHLEPEHRADAEEWIRLLHDQALLAEGSPIDDPAAFARRLSQVMGMAFGKASGDDPDAEESSSS